MCLVEGLKSGESAKCVGKLAGFTPIAGLESHWNVIREIGAMTIKQALDQVLQSMPEARLREVLDFACFLSANEERQQWQQFQRAQLSRAYGPNEPDYSDADLTAPRPQ